MKKIILFFAISIFLIILIPTAEATRGLLVTERSAAGTTPGYLNWTGTAWSGLGTTNAVGNTVQWLELKANPARNETILATLDADSDIDVQIWNGVSWSAATEITANASTNTYRTFDIGIMSLSGEVMIAYGNGTVGWIGYKIWNGQEWSAEQNVSTGGTAVINWVRLEARNNSNEMMLVAMDANARIDAIPWNGTAFESVQNLETASEAATVQTFDVAYESSGDALIVWVDAALATPEYKEYFSTGVWNNTGVAGSFATASIYWIRTVNYPGSDRIMMCGEVFTANDLYCQEWNGASWGTVTALNAAIEAVTTYRHMDIAPVINNTGFLVGVDTSNVDYFSGYQCTFAANCTAGRWSAIITAPWGTTDMGVDASWINMDPDPDNPARVFALMRGQGATVNVYKGSTSCTAITCAAVETSIAVTTTSVQTYEQFQFVFSRFISDKIAPAVTLNSPANGSSQSSPVTFNCSAKDAVQLNNITLYGNWSGWHANETKSSGGTSNSTTFSKILGSGAYTWNCYACDTNNNCAFGATNWTFTISVADLSFNMGYPATGCTEGKGCTTGGCTACTRCWFETSDTDGYANENQVNCQGQTASMPFYNFTNTGNVNLNWTMKLDSNLDTSKFRHKVSVGSGGYQATCTPDTEPPSTTTCIYVETTTARVIAKDIPPTGIDFNSSWAWADFINVLPSDTTNRTLTHTSVSG